MPSKMLKRRRIQDDDKDEEDNNNNNDDNDNEEDVHKEDDDTEKDVREGDVGDDDIEDDDIEKDDVEDNVAVNDDVEVGDTDDDDIEDDDVKDDNAANDDVEEDDAANDDVEEDSVKDDNAEDVDVEDDDAENVDVENDDVEDNDVEEDDVEEDDVEEDDADNDDGENSDDENDDGEDSDDENDDGNDSDDENDDGNDSDDEDDDVENDNDESNIVGDDDDDENSTGGDLIIDDDLPHVSSAPLHLAQESRKNISRRRLKELSKSFKINRGPWRHKEIKRLKKNWKRIGKYNPDFSDPRYAFGTGQYFETELNPLEVQEKMRAYKKFRMMHRMAYKLDNRLICDIYIRCRKMFYEKSFHFTSKHEVSPELEREVRKDLAKMESVVAISSRYNISPAVIEAMKRRPNVRRRFTWRQESEQNLLRIIEFTHRKVSDGGIMLARDIDWELVAKEMKRQNWPVNRDQCYNKYVKLVPDAVVRRHSSE